MRNIFLSCTPTRFLPTTGAPPAYANPRLKSAPHDLDACCSIAMHTAKCSPERPHSGYLLPVPCPISRIGSPRTAFNPHTLTALAAYCKSPYPHRSASTASEQLKFSQRSTADTALEILHQLTATMLLSFHFAKHWEANRGAIDPPSHLCIQPKFVAAKLLRRLRLRLP